jgi:DNA-binding response OmpR family regulator
VVGDVEVLLVEDDATLRSVLSMHLETAGLAVHAVGDGDAALQACRELRPHILVLDVMLPGASGLEVAREIRDSYDPVPGIVMITALGGEDDVVRGLHSGADDYVVKPVRPRELIARIFSLARRLRPVQEAERSFGRLRIWPVERRVEVDGEQLHLTPTELALLLELSSVPLRVFTRAELLSTVFDTDHPGYARNVDCHITRLRRKLEARDWTPAPVETVHGQGYRFVPHT